MSLFAERKVLDLRIPAGKFDKEASQVLRDWADGSAGTPPSSRRLPRIRDRIDENKPADVCCTVPDAQLNVPAFPSSSSSCSYN